jgi:pyruvate dehydrogenase E1 component alpha subunit
VTDAVEFAETSPYPEAADLYKDIYFEPNYPFIKE